MKLKKKVKISKLDNNTNKFLKFLIILVSFIAVLFFVITFGAPVKYDLNIGDVADEDIITPIDIKDNISTEKKINLAEKNVEPIYKFKKEVTDSSQKKLYKILATIQTVRQNENLTFKNKVSYLNTYLSSYIDLTENEIKQCLDISDTQYANFQIVLLDIHREIMGEGILEGEIDKALGKIRSQIKQSDIIDDNTDLAFSMLSSVIEPNKVVDREATNIQLNEVRKNVEPVIYTEGEKIIAKGDKITAEQYNMLKELDLLKHGKYSLDLVFFMSALTLCIIILLIIVGYIQFFFRKLFNDVKNVLLLSMIFVLTTGFVSMLTLVDYKNIYLIPTLAAAMIVSMLFGARLAVLINFTIVIITSLIVKADTSLICIALIGGTFSTFVILKADQRSKMALSGLIISLVNALLIISFSLIAHNDIKTSLISGALGILFGFIAMFLSIGVLPFIETTFNIITPLKLLELSNPNQKLIKKMLLEAAGTYHHSLMVGNLAEAATEAIGGNPLLARVAAYYHDIGKLNRPYFYKENQYNENPHDKMTPSLSTLVVTSHVKDGVELAKEHNIPLVIRDIIKQHHGTTLVKYFYHKALSENEDKEIPDKDFRYEGPKPQTKEAAVVMLADSVEAAVRSMNEKTEGLVEGLVRKIIKEKLEDGQFDESDITLKDLDTVAKSFMNVLSGIFHERIEYPEIKTNNNKEVKM